MHRCLAGTQQAREIESLGLQKLTIATDVGFPVSFFPHLCYC
jgi:hypothetical protein